MTATVNTAEIAANVRTEAAAMPDREAISATFSGRELGVRRWMLAEIKVSHTDTTVTVHFPRGKALTAYFLAGALLDGASQHLPLEAGGEIVQDDDRTFTLKF
jgi:hypothetical protein